MANLGRGLILSGMSSATLNVGLVGTAVIPGAISAMHIGSTTLNASVEMTKGNGILQSSIAPVTVNVGHDIGQLSIEMSSSNNGDNWGTALWLMQN